MPIATPRARRTAAAVTLIVVAAVAVAFAWNVSRYYFLSDDAFISFRYALHLSRGEGLTWNPGERVEGYSNFLWVLLTAAVIRRTFAELEIVH